MASLLLQNLYDELTELAERTSLIKALIISYGGEIPDDNTTPNYNDGKLLISSSYDEAYRKLHYDANATWKEKIISVLNFHKKPMTTKEIAQFLNRQLVVDIPDLDYNHVHSMVTQIASAMGRAGEIYVDNSSFRNKYYTTLGEL